MAQSTRWCFTLNNYSQDEYDTLKTLDTKYIIVGKETAATGTYHLQGFMLFHSNKRLTAVKKIFKRAHWEVAKGTAEQNITYCSKENDFIEIGTRPVCPKEKGEMEKQRWKNIIQMAKDGTLEENEPKIYYRTIRTALFLEAKFRPAPPDLDYLPGIWIYGPAGSGKSRKARKDYPGAYLKKADNKWWDGYNNEDSVIIDDFDKFMVSQGHNLKIWLDRYSFPAEIKQSTARIRPKTVIVTSQYHPSEIWDDKETQDAITRRCLFIYMENGHCVVKE